MNRRDELAAFLRARREALRPSDVGLPPGRGRRTPGLRREEIALLAGVSVTWYTWLEQGRPINASVDVLEALARSLRLDDAERHHLLALATHPDVRRQGVGGQLLDHLLGFARAKAFALITLEVRRTNVPAITLYERAGFAPPTPTSLRKTSVAATRR